MATHNDFGRWGEQKAAEYLQKKGYTIVQRDWKYGRRDLDIIALSPQGDTLAVVEVKTRSSKELSTPEAAVDWRKMHNIAVATDAFLRRYPVTCDVRFDIVTVVGSGDTAEIDHIENAFVPPLR